MHSEPTLVPSRPPSATHEVIVVLETIHVPWLEEDPLDLGGVPGRTYEALVYRNTNAAAGDDVAARIRDASIVVCTQCRLTREVLAEAKSLKCILSHPVGTDHIDIAYCRENNIQVMNCTGCNPETVAEHAISLYFATRRSLIPVHNVLTSFTARTPNGWKTKGSINARMRDSLGAPPRTCRQEVAGIIGYGSVGKEIARLCTALGMKVIIAERKDSLSSSTSAAGAAGHDPTTNQPPRLPFPTVLSTSTILFLSLPLLPTTRSLLSHAEFALLTPSLAPTLINVSRGGIVDEAAALAALESGRLFGYGTDVFAVEPAGDDGDSVLLSGGRAGPAGGKGAPEAVEAAGREEGGEQEERKERTQLNVVATGHLAWFSATTMANQVRKVRENLRAWGEGRGDGDVVVLGTKRQAGM